MRKLRFSLLFAALLALTLVAGAQTQPLTITPPAGSPGTNHTVIGIGLVPMQQYTLTVVFGGTPVFSTTLSADSNGQVSIDLLTEPSDTPGTYTVNLSEGDSIIRTGTITITAQIQPPVGTSLSYNQTLSSTLDPNRAEDQYTFEGAQGDIVTVSMRSADFDTFLMLYGPDGGQLRFNDNAIPPTDSGLFAYELPANGRYLLIATSRDAAETGGSSRVSGTYSLTLSVARRAQEGTIAPGETIAGELSLVAQRAQYTFTGRGGDVVTIDQRSDAFDSVVMLYTSDGTQLAQDDDGGGGLNARITRFRLPADGEYVIVIDGFRGFTGERRLQGKFTVTLDIEGQGPVVVQATPGQPTVVAQATPAPATPTPLPALAGASGTVDFDETTVGELTEQAQTGGFTFIGTAGDVITIALDSTAFDPKVQLVAPDGSVIAEDDDSGPDLNALIREYTLPRDGEYTIVVDGFRGAAGNRQLLGQFSLTLSRAGDTTAQQPTAAPQPGATATPAPQVSSGAIASGQTLNGEFSEATQNAAYSFEARAGDTVSIDLRSDEIDPLVRLLGPDGQVIAEDDDSGGGVQARIADFTLPADGTYTIEVDAFRGIDSARLVLGAFELTLNVTPAPVVEVQPTTPPEATSTPSAANPTPVSPAVTVQPPAQGSVVRINPSETAELTFTGAEDEAFTFRFTGSAGDVVGFTVTGDGSIDTSLAIVAEDGLAVASDDDSGEGFNPELLGVTLPAYGGYQVTVRPVVSGLTGTVTLTYKTFIQTALGQGAISVTLNDKYGPQVLRFTGHAGETVRLIVTSISQIGGEPEIVVTQAGEPVASQIIGSSLRLTIEFITPADGRVDVKVLREASAYGEIEISIERVVEEEPAPEDGE